MPYVRNEKHNMMIVIRYMAQYSFNSGLDDVFHKVYVCA